MFSENESFQKGFGRPFLPTPKTENQKSYIKDELLKRRNIRVSLFIEPNIKDIKISHIIGADCVELHTGQFCNLFNKGKKTYNSYLKIKKSAEFAKKIGLEVHAGHGLTYESAYKISRIKDISEFNIGHFIVAESIFLGLKKSIMRIKRIINK